MGNQKVEIVKIVEENKTLRKRHIYIVPLHIINKGGDSSEKQTDNSYSVQFLWQK